MADLSKAGPAPMQRRGLMLVISSPSGAGKSTLARRLVDEDPEMTMSISVTTRPQRPGERDGVDYSFVDDARYRQMQEQGELLEAAVVYGYGYGTPRRPVEEALAAGRDVLFDIDWQGTQQLAERARNDLVRVFLLPPTRRELERRLRRRAQDSDEVIANRMAKASEQMSHWPEYDYVVVNENVDRTYAALGAIVTAERQRRDRLISLSAFVKALQEEEA